MNLGIPLTASLIGKFLDGVPLDELYVRAPRCFDTLLDTVRDPKVADEVARLSKLTVEEARDSAMSILDALLFNHKKDPFISLGLTKDAGQFEAGKRRRRLLATFHPDHYQNKQVYEDRTKKINEVFEAVSTDKRSAPTEKPHSGKSSTATGSSGKRSVIRYLRPIPSIIIAITFVLAIISTVRFYLTVAPNKTETAAAESQSPRSESFSADHDTFSGQTPEGQNYSGFEYIRHNDVEELLDQYCAYYAKGDLEAYMSLFSEDAFENGKPVASLIEEYRRLFKSGKRNYRMENVSIYVGDDDMAVVRADYEVKNLDQKENISYFHKGETKFVIQEIEGLLKIVSVTYD